MSHTSAVSTSNWPALEWSEWRETAQTLHMWTQIVGKIRMEQSPWQNHSWHVTLYVTPRGLTTGVIPHGTRTFRIDFDLVEHRLVIESCEGGMDAIPLRSQDTADFYRAVITALEALGYPVTISTTPNEVEDTIPFDQDRTHNTYEPDHAQAFWQVLYQADRVFRAFRSRYWGKSSPVHFFWGSFDLALTRFSGRTAPDHPGGPPNMPLWVAQEAYSHELASCGFWPGGDVSPHPVFYAYAYPAPDGYGQADVQPSEAFWSEEMGEWFLPLEAVRSAADPDATLLAFLESTWQAAAELGEWPLEDLERRHFPG